MPEFLGSVPFPNAPVANEQRRPVTCAWFLGHWRRPAVAHTWHPFLGWVPVCPSCVAFTQDHR